MATKAKTKRRRLSDEERAERARLAAEATARRVAREAEVDRKLEPLRRSATKRFGVRSPAPRQIADIPVRDGESTAMYLSRVTTLREMDYRNRMVGRWSHKNEGTPETHENAAKTRQGALARLFMSGHIDAVQLGMACEIAAVAERIQGDVEVRGASYEMRVDYSGSGRDVLVEGILRVRREVAYTWWRERIPDPKRAVLDMIIGDPESYSAIAIRYRMGKKRARKLLIDAINLWPAAMEHAEREVDNSTLAAAHAGLLGG